MTHPGIPPHLDGAAGPTPPEALLLDFGSVITVSMFERHRDTEARLGLPEGSLRWLGPIAPHTDPPWQAMQRDEIGERDSHTGILKPDPRAYALAVDGLGVAAEGILFVDDQFRNIAGVHRAGLQTQFFDLRDVDGSIAAAAARLRIPWEDTACHA